MKKAAPTVVEAVVQDELVVGLQKVVRLVVVIADMRAVGQSGRAGRGLVLAAVVVAAAVALHVLHRDAVVGEVGFGLAAEREEFDHRPSVVVAALEQIGFQVGGAAVDVTVRADVRQPCVDGPVGKADNWFLRQSPKVLNLPFKDGISRAERDNAIDVFIGEEYMDVLADGEWERRFTEKPEVFTREEKRAWLDQLKGVTLGSDAFFPFSDNIERAHKSGVEFIAQPGGSVRDDDVIATCNKYGMAMAFTGIRLFHH